MTREKAKECIESIIDTYQMLEEKQVNSDVPIDEEDIEALEMAISALSAIEDIKTEIADMDGDINGFYVHKDEVLAIIDKHIGKEK